MGERWRDRGGEVEGSWGRGGGLLGERWRVHGGDMVANEGDVEDEELARKLARTRGLQTSETAGSLERNLTLFTVQ